jgi:hypothetical protein
LSRGLGLRLGQLVRDVIVVDGESLEYVTEGSGCIWIRLVD